jgi:hypothetical protein
MTLPWGEGQSCFVADLGFDTFRPLAEHIQRGLHDREGLELLTRPIRLRAYEAAGIVAPLVRF